MWTRLVAALACASLLALAPPAVAGPDCPPNSHWEEGYGCRCDPGYHAGASGCEPNCTSNCPPPGSPCRPHCALVLDLLRKVDRGIVGLDAEAGALP
ncbi:MAG TPA: hypothetical protein VNX21_03310 [Candidatus Thermoplasmatota archaeon]|nr:hypothetical protein [Candidatus Thermoplasmatota archaeon]